MIKNESINNNIPAPGPPKTNITFGFVDAISISLYISIKKEISELISSQELLHIIITETIEKQNKKIK